MTWSVDTLNQEPLDSIVTWASQQVPTLRQMHAIKELAVRAGEIPHLLPTAIAAIGKHLGRESRFAGLPVGYLGAKVLHDGSDEARRALMIALATIGPVERDDLLRWLQPGPIPEPSTHAPASERELIFDRYVASGELDDAIRGVLRSPAPELKSDVLRLSGQPEAVAMVTLSCGRWTELECDGHRLSATLDTTVYWLPAEELAPLDPDLRVAVNPRGARWLVLARYTAAGFEVHPYHDRKRHSYAEMKRTDPGS